MDSSVRFNGNRAISIGRDSLVKFMGGAIKVSLVRFMEKVRLGAVAVRLSAPKASQAAAIENVKVFV